MSVSESWRALLRAYRASFGRIFKFRRDHRYWPNVIWPKTFNEKILYRSVFDRRPLFHTLSDKLAVRRYVRARVGDVVTIPTVLLSSRAPENLLTAPLPTCFVMKSNHGQGHIHLHSGGEPDRSKLVTLAKEWLAWDNYERRHQWCYKNIPKTIFLEEHLTRGGPPPDDYKFFCFDGIPRVIEFDTSRFTGMRRDFYDTDWRLLDFAFVDPQSGIDHPRPKNLDKMLDIARRLSSGLDFIRVDLYDLGDDVAFGELTCYPQNGRGRFTPRSWDLKLGRYWLLSSPSAS